VECGLSGRIGRLGGRDLKINKVSINEAVEEKILTLPFEGKPISILDENKLVIFRGNYKLTIAEIFSIFKNKVFRAGDLEYLKDGIINWNSHHLGYWDADQQTYVQIDLDQAGWWRQLPLLEVLTLQEARERYHQNLDGICWNMAACASRGSATLDFDKTHAYLEVAIPIGEGKYSIHAFGKFAFVFPATFFECFFSLCQNVHATIAYPDENIYFTERQHGRHSFLMNPCEAFKFMESIKEDMLKARVRNFIFQIQSENCAKWIQEKLEGVLGKEKVPNLYKMSMLDTEPQNAIIWIFRGIKMLPAPLQVPVLTNLHLLIGAGRKTWIEENGKLVPKSLTNHMFWETGDVYLPALLIKQHLAGDLAKNHEVKAGLHLR
jgi:hypothetical protein